MIGTSATAKSMKIGLQKDVAGRLGGVERLMTKLELDGREVLVLDDRGGR